MNVLGAVSLVRQVRASVRLAARVRALRFPMPDEVRRVAERARVPSRVDVVDSVEVFSFAHGFFAPRTFAGRGWIDWNVGNPILLKPEQLLRRAR